MQLWWGGLNGCSGRAENFKTLFLFTLQTGPYNLHITNMFGGPSQPSEEETRALNQLSGRTILTAAYAAIVLWVGMYSPIPVDPDPNIPRFSKRKY